ncbi:putative TIM-barrel fold metal-dependent hydrolase [Kribbella orskensis]|uniref:6-methylsalicylate decarboxylase n=1 Tax=Kribbella orskensis TaxID=2512216 RepID=A0ABY2BM15_9ACTN|nr:MULTISPECIES: amidohydrolase family protein [Kribbella]TCN41172.1 putative TIM-barrel fold metal-dependent hydrolase [Kribbella sp. VKM Ac-2500]TCO24424.1 putative TIM-barrel fold metal-dependent hydrolase [Kribbella orskensis]
MQPTVDVHAHFLLPEYVAAAERAGHLRPDGMPGWPEWNVRRQLDLMDDTGITKAVLSVSSPGVHFGDDFRAQVLARRMNEAAADLGEDHPGRFGFFASLPLPDVDGALVELEYAYDSLHADGVVLMSNAGGQYPGDPSWDRLWRELDARSAVVFLHPTSPPQWRQVALDRPRPMIEFLFDEARAVADLALTGIFTRYPNVRFIVTHAGDVLPLLGDRLDLFRHTYSTAPVDELPAVSSQLRNLWHDVAGTPVPGQLPILDAVAGADRLLYGSDYGFTPNEAIAEQVAALDASPAAEGWRARTTENAVRLLPVRVDA